MKIKYRFVNGEINEAEVSEELGAAIMDMDKKDIDAERRETRRHTSLDGMDYEGKFFKDNTNVEANVLKTEELNEIWRAISRLTPQQQMMVFSIFFEGVSINEYATWEGVDHSAISHRLKTVYGKLKKFL